MPATSMDWTDQAVDTLMRMYSAGEPHSRIAAALGTTRNACIGKVHRLGLSAPRVIQSERKVSPRPTRLSPPPSPKPLEPEPQPVVALPIAPAPSSRSGRGVLFLHLRPGQCRFIPGSPAGADTIYCGDPIATPGEPYCAEHRAICWAGRPPKTQPQAMRTLARGRAA